MVRHKNQQTKIFHHGHFHRDNINGRELIDDSIIRSTRGLFKS